MTENIDAALADWQGSLDAMRWAPGLPEEPVPADSFYDQTAETFNSAADDGFYSRYSTGPDAIWIPVISDPVRERFERDSWGAFWDRIWHEQFSRLVNRFIHPNLWDQQAVALASPIVPAIHPIGWLDEISPPVILISPADRMVWDPALERRLPPGVVLDGQTLQFAENVSVRLPRACRYDRALLHFCETCPRRGCHYDTDGDGNCHLCARCGSCFHPD